MKAKDLVTGDFTIGLFRFIIRLPVFETRSDDEAPFFEVLVSEKVGKEFFYVNLVEDSRFGLFSAFGNFSRPIAPEELVEYNSYLPRRNQLQSTWKLSRASVALLTELAAKAKKKPIQ